MSYGEGQEFSFGYNLFEMHIIYPTWDIEQLFGIISLELGREAWDRCIHLDTNGQQENDI